MGATTGMQGPNSRPSPSSSPSPNLYSTSRDWTQISQHRTPSRLRAAPSKWRGMRAWPVRSSILLPYMLLLLLGLFTGRVTAGSTLDRRKAGFVGHLDLAAPLLVDRSVTPEPFIDWAGRHEGGLVETTGLDKRRAGESTPPDTSGASNASMPSPFDSGIGAANLTSSCTAFFNTLLNDPEVQDCRPVSLLLMTSNGFFQATKNPKTTNEALSASCSASLSGCSNSLAAYAKQMKEDTSCGNEYKAQNPKVLQAYDGFVAYEPVYKATCMKDTTSGGYCFANAVTNSSSPTSSYVYYLPLGLPLPAGTMPTCNTCLSNTMKAYAPYAGNASTPLSSVYGSAVGQMDVACGPTFVTEVPTVKGAAASLTTPGWLTALAVLAMFLLS